MKNLIILLEDQEAATVAELTDINRQIVLLKAKRIRLNSFLRDIKNKLEKMDTEIEITELLNLQK